MAFLLLNVFTFHYASTLSPLHKNAKTCMLHLHSIMLLLYPNKLVSLSSSHAFTFHYASTLSVHMLPRQLSFLYLHSIMLLLYLVSFFSPHFLHFKPAFCPPSFLFIFLLQNHPVQNLKTQILLGSPRFVYLPEILHYFQSTITKSCSFYHHPHPRTL